MTLFFADEKLPQILLLNPTQESIEYALIAALKITHFETRPALNENGVSLDSCISLLVDKLAEIYKPKAEITHCEKEECIRDYWTESNHPQISPFFCNKTMLKIAFYCNNKRMIQQILPTLEDTENALITELTSKNKFNPGIGLLLNILSQTYKAQSKIDEACCIM
jgi:hypothetical protein